MKRSPPRSREKNVGIPHALGGMVGVLTFLVISVFAFAVTDRYLLGSPSLASVISSVLVDLANGDRSANALGGLTISPMLSAAAQAKADDMATQGYFAHVSPDGKNSWYWFKEAGYTFLYAGENLAVDFSDSIDVESAWMNSPTHRANILNEHFTEIGIATAQGSFEGHSTTFVVQMFGTPRAEAATSPIRTISSPVEATAPALATTATTPVATTGVAAAVLGAEADSILAPGSSPLASWWQHLITSPRTILLYAYYALAIIVLLILVYVTELEFHRRHLRHVLAAVFLAVLMAGFFLLATMAFFSPPAVTEIGWGTILLP